MIVAIVILSLLVALLSYLLYINFRRAEAAEEYCEAYVRFISLLYLKFVATRNHMKEVDRLGAFQADDEVGIIFKQLDGSIEELHTFITRYINAEDEKDEKAKD